MRSVTFKMHQIRFLSGLRPDPTGKFMTLPQNSQAGMPDWPGVLECRSNLALRRARKCTKPQYAFRD